MTNISRKFIAFDLDTKELKKFLTDYRLAYTQIKSFMEENGFIHEQGSAYSSINNISYSDVQILITEFSETFNWAQKCVKKLQVTMIGNQFDFKRYLNNDIEELDVIKQESEIKQNIYVPNYKIKKVK